MVNPRIRLEALHPSHARALFAALDDPRMWQFIGEPEARTAEDMEHRIARVLLGPPSDSDESWINFAVLEGDTVIGRVEATLHDGIAEIAFLIGPDWWHRGCGSSATTLLLEHLSASGTTDFWATTAPDNVASVCLLQRLGFTETAPDSAPNLLSYDDGDRVFHRHDGRRDGEAFAHEEVSTAMTQDARTLAAAAYKRFWDLLERPPGDARDRELVAAAFASRLHWLGIGGPQELAIADWMVSRACAATGNPRLALLFAEAALGQVQDGFPHWLKASMHEGLARAQISAGLSPEAAKTAAHQ